MKKTVPMMIVFTALPLFMVSAQNTPREKERPAKAEKVEQKAERKEAAKEKRNIEAAEELTVDEFLLKRNDLKGKVIELTFDRVISLKQMGKDGYVALVSFQKTRLADGVTILVPAEGLEFFQELDKPELQRRESVYVEVMDAGKLRALGTRYREDKPKGQRYGW